MTEISLDEYAERLARTGMPDREVARALFYVEHYGFAAMDSHGCAVFRTPSCDNWNCLNPEHQNLGDSRTPEEDQACLASMQTGLSRRERRQMRKRK